MGAQYTEGVDLTTDLLLAAQRNEAKQAVAVVLARFNLPAADRKAILLDLATEQPSAAPAAPRAANGVAVPRGGTRGRPRKRGKNGAGSGRTDVLVAALAPNPGMPIADLATAVYGDGSELSRNKTRSLLNALKKQGRVVSRATGKWEVVR